MAAAPLQPKVDDPNVIPLTVDTLQNLMSGLGTGRDKRVHGEFVFSRRLTRADASAMYLNHWLAASVVDTIPGDMVREWRAVSGLDPGQLDTYEDAESSYGVKEALNRAMKWARLYGGAGVVMYVDGAGEFHEPLDLDRVKKGALRWLRVVDRHYLIPEHIEFLDPGSPNWMEPEHYRLAYGQDLIHRSRIIRFNGIELPLDLAMREHFWGASILERAFDPIRNAETVMDSIAGLVIEAKVDVFKIPDLFNLLKTEEGKKLIMDRVRLGQMGKSSVNALLMDSEEEYEQKQSALAQGLAPLVEQYLVPVSAASDIPVTRLLGTSAKGLNATGEGDLATYYDSVSAMQIGSLSPQLATLDEVLLRSTFGTRPEEFASEWRPLWQLDGKELAEVEYIRAQRDDLNIANGLIEPYHAAAELQEQGTYSTLEGEHVALLKGAALEEDPEPDLLLDPRMAPPTSPEFGTENLEV